MYNVKCKNDQYVQNNVTMQATAEFGSDLTLN